MNPKCDHCPLKGRDLECPRWPTNHTRYCEWVDPAHPGHKPAGAAALVAIAEGRPFRPEPAGQAVAFPPLSTQAANLAGALGRFAASGLAMASVELRDERRALCGQCEHKDGNRCRKCGCGLWAKTAIATEVCPIAKW